LESFGHIDCKIVIFILPLFLKKTHVSFVKYKGNTGLFSKKDVEIFLATHLEVKFYFKTYSNEIK